MDIASDLNFFVRGVAEINRPVIVVAYGGSLDRRYHGAGSRLVRFWPARQESKKETMTTKSPDPSEIGSIFASGEVAEQRQSSKAQREKVNAAANEMLLEVANLRLGNRVLDVAAGTGDQTLMAARRVGPRTTYWPRTFLPICSSSLPMQHGRRVSHERRDPRYGCGEP